MDPNATLAIIRDTTTAMLDRIEAVFDLHDWLDKGGAAPDDFTGEDIAPFLYIAGSLRNDARIAVRCI